MGQNHHLPLTRKKLRLLMHISLVITLLSVALMFWTYRPFQDKLFQHGAQIYQRNAESPAPPQLPLPKNCGPGSNASRAISFVAVDKTKTVLISAYLEHRTDKKEVRVLAIVLRNETVAYRCRLCCQDQLHLSEGVSSTHSDHFTFPYGTADIMCPLPSGCEAPSYIAVTSADIPQDKSDHVFLEIMNQKPRSDSFPYNFTVCLSTMFDFTNVLQLVQSLEMLQFLGVNRVVVYKTSCSPDTQRVLDYYTNKGLVEVIPWSLSRFLRVSRGWLPKHGPGDLHYFGQIPALNDCVYRYMYRSRYVALHDIDELILPQSFNSWLELLPLLEMKYGPNKCYMFQSNLFPSNVALPPPIPHCLPPMGCWEKVPGVNILAHLYQVPILPQFNNFKIIVSPRAVFSTTVHGVLRSQSGCVWVDRTIARMYHTRAQKETLLAPDQLIYDSRLLSYGARLTPAVNTVLKETGFVPKHSTCSFPCGFATVSQYLKGLYDG